MKFSLAVHVALSLGSPTPASEKKKTIAHQNTNDYIVGTHMYVVALMYVHL